MSLRIGQSVGILLVVVCALSCGREVETRPASTSAPERPNVLLIVTDALRFDRLDGSRNGVPLMPNLRAFADTSWNFTNARVQATWTKPSMASLFTSLYPEVHQVLFGIHDTVYEGQPTRADVLPETLETLAGYLKSQGYATAAIQTNANITADFGFNQGFDSYVFHPYPEYQAGDVTDEALATLDRLHPPFLLYTHYMDAHAPYDPPAEYRKPLGPEPEVTDADRELIKNYAASYVDRVLYEIGLTKDRKFGNLSEAGEAYVRYCYDGEALFLDHELARLLAAVREKFPNTIVVLTADHGEELWDHGSIGHGKTVYEELTHVPLVVHVPGASPQAVNAPVESIDVLPTLAQLLKLEPRSGWQGRSFSDPGALEPNRPIYSSTQGSIPGSNVDFAAVVVGDNKLIRDRKKHEDRYFDLAGDPLEQRPLESMDQGEQLGRLWRAHLESAEKNPLRPADRTTAEIDPETVEAIKAIGYGK